jgi:hypothetical protein
MVRNGVSAPYRMVPVEYSLGPSLSPARSSSALVKIISVLADGSWAVVTP